MNITEHLLTCLMEECAEIQKEAAKALRFGLDDHAPSAPDVSNAQAVARECADLIAVMEMLEERGDIPAPDRRGLIRRKKEKVAKYMRYAEERGTLTPVQSGEMTALENE